MKKLTIACRSLASFGMRAALAMAVGLLFTSNVHAYNGGAGTPYDDPPLIIDAPWFATGAAPPAFFWNSGSPAFNIEGPYTFIATGQVRLDVTDAGQTRTIGNLQRIGDSLGCRKFGSRIMGKQANFITRIRPATKFLV